MEAYALFFIGCGLIGIPALLLCLLLAAPSGAAAAVARRPRRRRLDPHPRLE